MKQDLTPNTETALQPLEQSVQERVQAMVAAATNRRTFLKGSGVVVGGLALAACGAENTTGGSSASPSSGKLKGDLQLAGVAASLEILAVETYKAALDAATAGKLGAVPPAVAEFVKTAMKQHQDHADAWNVIIMASGHAKVTEPDAAVKPQIDAAFKDVKDVVGVAKLALTLENVAAQTYFNVISVLKDKKALKIASEIEPVEHQHAAILHFVLGEYPVPDVFTKTDLARPASDYNG